MKRRTARLAFAAMAAAACSQDVAQQQPANGLATEPASAGEQSPEVAQPDPEAIAAKADEAPVDTSEHALAIARFEKDVLSACIAARATIVRPDDHVFEEPARVAAFVLFDELSTAIEGGKGVLSNGPARFTEALEELVGLYEEALKSEQKEKMDAARTALDEASRWPPKGYEKDAESGELVLAKSCEFPNRVALGTCRVHGRNQSLEWSGAVHTFSAARSRSDKVMKNCLRIQGDWSEPDESTAARERLRQRAGQLDQILGE